MCVSTTAAGVASSARSSRSEEHTSELQSQSNLVCRLLLEKKKNRSLAVATTGRDKRHQQDWAYAAQRHVLPGHSCVRASCGRQYSSIRTLRPSAARSAFAL